MLHPLIQIEQIVEQQFLLPSLENLQLSEIEQKKILFGFTFKFDILDEHRLSVDSKIIYQYPLTESGENVPILSYETNFVLKVKDIKEEYKHETNKQTIDTIVIQLIYSTIRGMLVVRTSGTHMSPFPLLVIDPTKLPLILEEPDQ